MATVNFNLRVTDSPKPQLIYLVFRNNNDVLKYSTGFKVCPSDWNITKGRIKNVGHVLNREKINNRLNDFQTEVLEKVGELKASGEAITKDSIKLFLDELTGKKQVTPKTLFGFIENFIKNAPIRINPTTGKNVSLNTIKAYKTSLRKLRDFSKYRNAEFDFRDIDLDFYNEYTDYLSQTINQSTNTIGKEIKTLKTFLNAANELGLTQQQAYKRKSFKVVSEDSEAVYLNESELSQLYSLDLTDNKRLEQVRDLFLVGCWTGCRFSDLTTISNDNIKDNTIEFEQQKTGNKVVIPFHAVVKAIWNKYNGNFPEPISNQKFNDYIKEVCKLAKIEGVEFKAITKGGTRRSKKYKKWELVTSHTARRSFATNLYVSGFPAISIMQITGHKTEKAFLKYIKLDTLGHAKLLQAHWAKTGSNLKIAK